jgi:hypothetical protein
MHTHSSINQQALFAFPEYNTKFVDAEKYYIAQSQTYDTTNLRAFHSTAILLKGLDTLQFPEIHEIRAAIWSLTQDLTTINYAKSLGGFKDCVPGALVKEATFNNVTNKLIPATYHHCGILCVVKWFELYLQVRYLCNLIAKKY